jgi:hypothetical protein
MKKFFTFMFILFIGLLFLADNTNAQTALGNFSANIKGSFEDATFGAASNPKTYQGSSTSWNTYYNALVASTSQHRTGGNSLLMSVPGGLVIWSPTWTSGTIQASTSYIVQFYYINPGTKTSMASPQVSIFDNASNSAGYSSTVSLGLSTGVSSWTKVTVTVTSGSVTANYGALRISGPTPSATLYFDDFCVYPAANGVDNTAPTWGAGLFTATSGNGTVSLSWPTATDGGTDAGGLAGYMIVRNTVAISKTPLVNAIYTVTSGYTATVPTVTSGDTIGTALSPANVVITYTAPGTTTYIDNNVTHNTTYYYNVYAVDNAFNYSTVMSGSATPALPVEMTTYIAKVNGQVVTLNWTTATEIQNSGWDIERSNGYGQWTKIGFKQGNGSSTIPHQYSFIDKSSKQNGNYAYRLKQIDYNGTNTYSREVETIIDVPLAYSLNQNYPNPFNPSTTINYEIPVSNKITIKVYNILGDEVTTLVNEQKDAGRYQVIFNASRYTSGVYFYRVQAGNFVQTKKMILLK